MRLYKIVSPAYTFDNGDESPKIVAWGGTQADARKRRIELEEPFKDIPSKKRPKVHVEEIDVPTNKEGLLKFLNDELPSY